MKTVSFPCPHTTSMCPITFCTGEARDTGKDKFLCGKCGSSYNSYETAQELRVEAYETASKLCMEHSHEYMLEATKLTHIIKAKLAK